MEWISVNDRLPEPVPTDEGRNHECDVLVYVKCADRDDITPYVTTGYLREEPLYFSENEVVGNHGFSCDWTVWSWSYFCEPEVTHWMPLPDPPKKLDGVDNA